MGTEFDDQGLEVLTSILLFVLFILCLERIHQLKDLGVLVVVTTGCNVTDEGMSALQKALEEMELDAWYKAKDYEGD